jgi:hypothetical protein
MPFVKPFTGQCQLCRRYGSSCQCPPARLEAYQNQLAQLKDIVALVTSDTSDPVSSEYGASRALLALAPRTVIKESALADRYDELAALAARVAAMLRAQPRASA